MKSPDIDEGCTQSLLLRAEKLKTRELLKKLFLYSTCNYSFENFFIILLEICII